MCVCVCVCVYIYIYIHTYIHTYNWGFPHSSSACNAGDPCSIPGSEKSPEKEMATHSSILTWRIS